MLNTFQCYRNPEIEDFLKTLSIPFEKSARGRTYLLIANVKENESPVVTGYFTIAMHIMELSSKNISKSKMRRLVGMYYDPCVDMVKVPCYLLGQIGKNDAMVEQLDGDVLMGVAMQAINDAHRLLGGRFVKVDCADIVGLMRFYESHGFKMVQHDRTSGMNELVRFL